MLGAGWDTNHFRVNVRADRSGKLGVCWPLTPDKSEVPTVKEMWAPRKYLKSGLAPAGPVIARNVAVEGLIEDER